jgi:hypothetical protein
VCSLVLVRLLLVPMRQLWSMNARFLFGDPGSMYPCRTRIGKEGNRVDGRTPFGSVRQWPLRRRQTLWYSWSVRYSLVCLMKPWLQSLGARINIDRQCDYNTGWLLRGSVKACWPPRQSAEAAKMVCQLAQKILENRCNCHAN